MKKPHESDTLLQITSLPTNNNKHNFTPEAHSTKSVHGHWCKGRTIPLATDLWTKQLPISDTTQLFVQTGFPHFHYISWVTEWYYWDTSSPWHAFSKSPKKACFWFCSTHVYVAILKRSLLVSSVCWSVITYTHSHRVESQSAIICFQLSTYCLLFDISLLYAQGDRELLCKETIFYVPSTKGG